MTDSRAATGSDRLPWLTDDEPTLAHAVRIDPRRWWLAASAAFLFVSGATYWIGSNGRTPPEAGIPASSPRPSPTLAVPDGQVSGSSLGQSPRVEPSPATAVEPAPAPAMPEIAPSNSAPVRMAPSRRDVVEPSPLAETAPVTDQSADLLAASPVQPAEPAIPNPWPVRVHDGASGRLVRVGTFRTSHQAKKGWWAIMKINPTLKRLPALVVPVQSVRNGSTYYRIQMGTTSQAHSTVLCQKMRMIGESCVVIEVDNRGSAVAA